MNDDNENEIISIFSDSEECDNDLKHDAAVDDENNNVEATEIPPRKKKKEALLTSNKPYTPFTTNNNQQQLKFSPPPNDKDIVDLLDTDSDDDNENDVNNKNEDDNDSYIEIVHPPNGVARSGPQDVAHIFANIKKPARDNRLCAVNQHGIKEPELTKKLDVGAESTNRVSTTTNAMTTDNNINNNSNNHNYLCRFPCACQKAKCSNYIVDVMPSKNFARAIFLQYCSTTESTRRSTKYPRKARNWQINSKTTSTFIVYTNNNNESASLSDTKYLREINCKDD